ncbi:MAG TPA: hypothetical protein PLR99_28775, partial [Polyangiaceae bacterium]|nr:hypothetical protein [Polyangiaceae bacterium]
MTTCSKCHAELIGVRKFCSACGAPVADAPAPSGPASDVISVGRQGGDVDPLARTAMPDSKSGPATPPSAHDAASALAALGQTAPQSPSAKRPVNATVPLTAMPGWMSFLAQFNPMTWAIDAVRPLILSGWTE